MIISRSLSKRVEDYKNPSAHTELAKKISARDPGNAYKIGDRVKYVIISGTKKDKNSSLAEDPIYAFENGLILNTSWYLEGQLAKPIQRILYYVMKKDRVMRSIVIDDPNANWIKKHGINLENLSESDIIFPEEEEEESDRDEFQFDNDDYETYNNDNHTPYRYNNVNKRKKGQEIEEEEKVIPNKKPKIAVNNTNNSLFSTFGIGNEKSLQKKVIGQNRIMIEMDEKKKKKMTKKESEKGAFKSAMSSESCMELVVKNSSCSVESMEYITEECEKKTYKNHFDDCKIVRRCPECNNPIKNNKRNMCDKCSENRDLVDKTRKKFKKMLKSEENNQWEIQKICETCVKDTPQSNYKSCKNTDCSNLWKRLTSGRELNRLQKMKFYDW